MSQRVADARIVSHLAADGEEEPCGADAFARGAHVAAWARDSDGHPAVQLPRVLAPSRRGAGNRAGPLATGRALRVEQRFGEYLVEGGFPEAQGLKAAAGVELLQGYVDTVLFRDVVERHDVSQVAALRWLVRQCLRNPCG